MDPHIWYLEVHRSRADRVNRCVRNVEIECRNGASRWKKEDRRSSPLQRGFSARVSLLLFCFASVFRSHPRPTYANGVE